LQVTALAGALVTHGPEGSGNPTRVAYAPAGFNAVYRRWEVVARDNRVELALSLTGGAAYHRPVLVVRSFSWDPGAAIGVSLDGATLVEGSDYLTSYDPI